MKIIFFGTSEFAVPALESLVGKKYDIAAVVTTPDEPSGREGTLTPSPIKITAQKLGLCVLQPDKLRDNEQFLDKLLLEIKPDLGIVASYGRIIPSYFIDAFSLGILNIHPSLLPKYRGPSPIQTQLLYGERESGVTIIKIDDKVDHGPILKMRVFDTKNENYEQLHDRLSVLGAELLVEVLPDYINGKIKLQEQNHDLATFTNMIKKEDGKIDWNKSSHHIFNQFRAYYSWPGLWTTWNDKILKINTCRIGASMPTATVGTVIFENKIVSVVCGNGCIELIDVQLEGGKEMPVNIFVSGHRNFVGSQLK